MIAPPAYGWVLEAEGCQVDLQNFTDDMLYFDEPLSPRLENLLQSAADQYGPDAEALLMEASALEPDNLSVLVGLYRYYYYQHRYQNAIAVAHRVMHVVGRRIEFPPRWQDVTMAHVINGTEHSFGLVRFYLFALKAAGYINLRLGNFAEGKSMITKVVAMDTADRLGARLLLDILGAHNADVIPFTAKRMEVCR